MGLRRQFVRLAALAVLLGTVAVTAITSPAAAGVTPWTGAAAAGTGWVRCANLSPATPTAEVYADVYLYPFGNPAHPIVLRHVGYGDVSSYLPVGAGEYTVAMRPEGASASSPPVVSVNFMVSAGAYYTVASIGSVANRRLEVLQDQMAAPEGQALVRIFQASVQHPTVTVSVGPDVSARRLAFGSATTYQAIGPGVQTVVVSTSGGHATTPVTFAAGSVHTLVVLDGPSGLKVDDVTDAAGSQVIPKGGAATGLGGMAAGGGGPDLAPWLATLAAGLLLATVGAAGLRRSRGLISTARGRR